MHNLKHKQLKLNIFHVIPCSASEDRNSLCEKKTGRAKVKKTKKKTHAHKINQLFYKLSFGALRCFQKVTDSNDISESFCNGPADAWQAVRHTWQKHADTQGGTRLPLIDGGPPS